MVLRGGARGGEGGGGVEQRSSSSSVGVSQQWQESKQEHNKTVHLHKEEKKNEEVDQDRDQDQDQTSAAAPGLLRHCVETREHSEEELRQREAQQLDFRSLLGRRALKTKQGEEPREAGPPIATVEQHHRHHMDFKANLKGVKPKAEEERKVNSSQQVDFRSVLGKKGPPSSNGNKASETPGKNPASDFRSVLANKKTPTGPEKNGESEKTVVNNCVDGAINEKKSGGGGGGGEVPEFVEKLTDVTVLDGQRLRLQCRLADPADASLTWTLDGKVIKSSKFIVLAKEGQRSRTHTVIHTHRHTHLLSKTFLSVFVSV